MDKVKVLFTASEAVPYAKTGGLADVSGALPRFLQEAGAEAKSVLPFYRQVRETKKKFKPVEGGRLIQYTLGPHHLEFSLLTDGKTPETVFVKNDRLYDRTDLYRDPTTGKDWADNDDRYITYAIASLLACKETGFKPDIIHANDWQAALSLAFARTVFKDDPFFAETHTVFTIHNVAYQGHFPKETFYKLGINPHLFYPASPFEFWGKVNFMKIGISYADVINTVSERYAVEIQSDPEFGHGLEGVLRERNADLFGIINGIDYDEWNPEGDKLIPQRYGPKTLEKKKKNKEALLKKCGLTGATDPLLGMITRLVDQKGLDLFADIADDLLSLKVKMVVLGTGDARYHELFKDLEKKYPKKIKAFLTFDNKLAHWIEAGADLFLMPSRYEPCGLNQLYSLKYGTVPVVRETGGLADTVEPADLAGTRGTGFVFKHYDSGEFFDAVKKAIALYGNKTAWKKLQLRGMDKDFSWHSSAVKYLDLYQKALAKEPVEAA